MYCVLEAIYLMPSLSSHSNNNVGNVWNISLRRQCHAQAVSLRQARHSVRSNYITVESSPITCCPTQWRLAMPYSSLHAVSMMSLFALQQICGWGATFAFHMHAFVALRLVPVACMLSFANRRLAKSPDIRLWTKSSQRRLHLLGFQSLKNQSGWQGKMASDPMAWC